MTDPKPKPTWRRRILNYILIAVALVMMLPIAAFAILSATASRPDHLGVTNGQLAKCPDSPNCVSTQAEDDKHKMPAIAWTGSAKDALQRIKSAVGKLPRATIISETDDYIHNECTSLLFRFVDDVEFFIATDAQQIHFRSASRVGHSDMGANRSRMEKLTTMITKD